MATGAVTVAAGVDSLAQATDTIAKNRTSKVERYFSHGGFSVKGARPVGRAPYI